VNVSSPYIVADDWMCTQTGTVDGVKFWISFKQDQVDAITSITLKIFSDKPANPSTGAPSQPKTQLWAGTLSPPQFTVSSAVGPNAQGWYQPYDQQWWYPDHNYYYEVTANNLPSAYTQQSGTIYWLYVQVALAGGGGIKKVGWKTSLDHWNDNAVFWDLSLGTWRAISDPRPDHAGQPVDMAFVIIPEPATLALMGLGACLVLLRRSRR